MLHANSFCEETKANDHYFVVSGALSVEPGEGVSSETVYSIDASEFTSDLDINYDIYTVNKEGRRKPLGKIFSYFFAIVSMKYFGCGCIYGIDTRP